MSQLSDTSHLSPETLARLADEPATTAEARHLRECEACRAELVALRDQARQLGELPPLQPPPAVWAGLLDELRRAPAHRSAPAPRRATLLRLAAGIALFLAGTLTGAAMRGSPPPTPAAQDSIQTADHADDDEDAARTLRAAELAYYEALARYSSLAVPPDPNDAAARLAALEGIIFTTSAALGRAPGDPLINGYYLTAVAQREDFLRRLARHGDDWF